MWKSIQKHHPYTVEGLRDAASMLGRTYTCVKQHYYFRMKPRLKKFLNETVGNDVDPEWLKNYVAKTQEEEAGQIIAGLREKLAQLQEENARLNAQLAAYNEAMETIGLYYRTGGRLLKKLHPAAANVS